MPQACYYAIIEESTNDLVDDGIIRYSEDIIYPGQNTGIDALPSECEAYHFNIPGYYIQLVTVDIPVEVLLKYAC